MRNKILLSGLFSILFLTVFQGCVEDPTVITPLETYFEEDFSNLDLSTVESIETPFQSAFQSKSSRTKEGITLEEISSKLAEIFPDAEVLEVEEETERGLSVWEIKLKMPGGGILKLAFVQELGLIIKIKGKSGPFDYEVDPGGSFIPFSEAVQLALDAVDGEIEKWELELEEDNEWEYEIHIILDGKRYEVEIKGFENEVISVKQKDEDEDKDQEEEEAATPPEEVVELALSLFPGEIIHSETKKDDDLQLWKLYVESETGAIVKFKIVEDPLQLIEMESEKGPYDYDIDPGDPYLTLMEATEIAFNIFPGELRKWEFEIVNRDDMVLGVYEFKMVDGDKKVELLIHAETGEVLDIENSDHHGNNNQVPDEIAEYALSLFPGEIIEGHFQHNDHKNYWKLHIRSESGAVVRFLIEEDPISLLEMKAEEEPFDYNIEPGEDLISLEEARGIAASLNDGDLIQWKFGYEGDDGNFFPFYLLRLLQGDEDFKVLIHAETGEVIETNEPKEEDHGDHHDLAPEEVILLAKSYFEGEVIHSEKHIAGDLVVWELVLQSDSGAQVKFYIVESTQELLSMKGIEGPFDYNIEPGDPYISLNAAIEIAHAEFDGQMSRWEFRNDHIDDMEIRVYEIRLESENTKVEFVINAESGVIISIED
jgi:uncharacterized membrane protein YkoI